jgi:hypothetical protein
MSEVEKLRGLLRRVMTSACRVRDMQNLDTKKGLATAKALQVEIDNLDAALAEPQGEQQCQVCSGDCGAANPPVLNCPMREPAPAQDEREAFEAHLVANHRYQPYTLRSLREGDSYQGVSLPLAWSAWQARPAQTEQQGEPAPAQGEQIPRNQAIVEAFKQGVEWQRTRPAQTEQQPAMTAELRRFGPEEWQVYWTVDNDDARLFGRPLYYRNFKVGDKVQLYAAPIAQTAPPTPTPQQISDYLNGLDAIQRALVERDARQTAPQPEQSGLAKALNAALDDLECAIPTLKKAGWQTHNEEATIRRGRAALSVQRGDA